MRLLGLILAFAACSGPAAAASPENLAVVQAFKENCADLSSSELIAQRALASGWVEVRTDSTKELRAFLDVNSKRQDATSTHRAFAKSSLPGVYTIAGVTSDSRAELVECHVVLFDSTDWPDEAFFAELPRSLADAEVSKTDDIGDFLWHPGLYDGQEETAVVFMPANSRYRGQIAPIGLMILGRSYARSLLPPPIEIQASPIQTQR